MKKLYHKAVWVAYAFLLLGINIFAQNSNQSSPIDALSYGMVLDNPEKVLKNNAPGTIKMGTGMPHAFDAYSDNDEAESVYQKILSLDPSSIRALIPMAVLSYTKNKTAEAESYLSKAVNSGSMTRNAYAQLGFSLLVANKNKEAAIYYEKALAIEPRNIDFYNLACAYAKMNDSEKALKALDNSLKNGYGSKQQIESDPDFDLIRSDEGFKKLVSSIK